MADLFGAEISMATSTAVKLVASTDFDRRVLLATGQSLRIDFTSAGASTGALTWNFGNSSSIGLKLLAGQELWGWQNSGSSFNAEVIVSADV